MSSALSTLNTTTEVRPLSKAPNPQLLPGRRSINGCPLLRVCVHGVCVCVLFHYSLLCVCALGAQIPSMGHHTWPHVTSFHFLFLLPSNVCFGYVILLKYVMSSESEQRLRKREGIKRYTYGRQCWKVPMLISKFVENE